MMAKKKDEDTMEVEQKAAETIEDAAAEASAEETAPKSELDALREELESCKDQRLRLAAEYDNYRKRTAREREGLFTDATVMTIAEFLTVYDNLERALATPTQDDAYRKGIELTFAQLCETLQKLKVEEINPEGKKFDPNLHNAVMHVEDDALEEGTVAEVFQKGFQLNGKVIRHAMVKVAN